MSPRYAKSSESATTDDGLLFSKHIVSLLIICLFCLFFVGYVISYRVQLTAMLGSSDGNSKTDNSIVALSPWISLGPVLIGIASVVANVSAALFMASQYYVLEYALCYVIFPFSGSACAAVFIIFHVYGSLFLMGDLTALLNSTAMNGNPVLWASICVLSVFDINAIRLLPWKATSVSCKLQGLPTSTVFNVVTGSSFLKSLFMFGYVIYWNFYRTATTVALVFSSIQMAISAGSLIIHACGDIIEDESLVTIADNSHTSNPLVGKDSDGVHG